MISGRHMAVGLCRRFGYHSNDGNSRNARSEPTQPPSGSEVLRFSKPLKYHSQQAIFWPRQVKAGNFDPTIQTKRELHGRKSYTILDKLPSRNDHRHWCTV